jgi:hypothetical protein
MNKSEVLMFVPWWGFTAGVVLIVVVAYGYGRYRTAGLEREIARLRAQLEHEQEFSNELISLMPEDKEEPK